jgi:hypothetical protein
MIAIERIVRGLLLPVAGVYLLTHLGSDYGRLTEHLVRAVDLSPHGRAINPNSR